MILADAAAAPLRSGGAPQWVPAPRALYGDPLATAVFAAVASCCRWENSLEYQYRAEARWIARQVVRCDVRTAESHLHRLQEADLVMECAGGGYVLTEAGADILRPGSVGFAKVPLAEIDDSSTTWRDAITLATMRSLLSFSGGRGEITAEGVSAAQQRWIDKASVRLRGLKACCERTVRSAWHRLTARGAVQRTRTAIWKAYAWSLEIAKSRKRPERAKAPAPAIPTRDSGYREPERGPPDHEAASQALAILQKLQQH